MRTRWATALVVIGVVGLAGCGSTSSSEGGSTTSGPSARSTTPPGGGLTGTTWKLTSYQGTSGASVPAVAGVTADLAFQAHGVLGGSTGCNSFGGAYTTTGSRLTLIPGPTTLIGCSAAISAQETALFALFPKVTAYSVTGERLTLTGAGGATLMTYAAGQSGLIGTSWIATGVNNGKGAVESTSATSDLTATFDPGGAFSGFGGCNTLAGSYATSGANGLTITGVQATQKSCTPEVDALETLYTAALDRATTYERLNDQLTLRSATGELQITFRLQG